MKLTTNMVIMSNQPFNKDELQAKADAKARASVASDTGLDELMHFTLNNFSYRYLESKNTKSISITTPKENCWRAEGQESELIEALKAQNPTTKQALIQRAKIHAKKDGATVYPWIEITVNDQVAICCAGIDWESNGERDTVVESTERLNFEDVLHLRNRLAKVLEDVCGVF